MYLFRRVQKVFFQVIQFAKGEINTFSETHIPEKDIDNQQQTKTDNRDVPENVPENMSGNTRKPPTDIET
jgi:hypothetical protein